MESPTPKISVIIPTLDEADRIGATIDSARHGKNVEIVVADGGSGDATTGIASSKGATVLATPAGRAGQMNIAAVKAAGALLLFLHADTQLPDGYDEHVRRILADPANAGGAFELSIDGSLRALRLVVWATNLRARRAHMPYGDQAIFLRKDTFEKLGGFPDLPIMEDFEFVRRLRRRGRIVIAPAAVLTSGRRWKTVGLLKTSFINNAIVAAYFLGVPPSTLARWYHRQREK